MKQKLESTHDIVSWMEDGVYLVFDGDMLYDSNEEKPEDVYTSENLYVRVLRNKISGEIISRKHSDIVTYFIATITNNFDQALKIAVFFTLSIEDKIE